MLQRLGAMFVRYKNKVGNAIERTLQSKLQDVVSVKDYGAIGDGVYRSLGAKFTTLSMAQVVYPHAESLTQSQDWAAIQAALNSHSKVYIPAGKYMLSDTIEMRGGQTLQGDGIDSWVAGYAGFVKDNQGTHLIMVGDGNKKYTLDHVSNFDVEGGVIDNPAKSDAYTATAPSPNYSFTNFTNANASGAQRATLKPFSVALRCTGHGGVYLRDFRIVPNHRGQEGYKDELSTALGDAWDVGIWLENTSDSVLSSVQAVGYWRIAGVMKTCIPQEGSFVGGERDRIYNCTLQGYRGLLARSHDTYQVEGVSGNTVSIKWSASHTFEPSGKVRIQGKDRSYTSLSVSGDKLVFNGIDDVSGINTNSYVRVSGSSFGMSATQLNNTYIAALNHHARLPATSNLLDNRFVTSAACYEVAGEPIRAIKLSNCTVITWDDILGMTGGIRDFQTTDTYFESQPFRTSVQGLASTTQPAGSRMIALRGRQGSKTTGYQAIGCTYGPGVDLSPRYESDVSRYTTSGGMFNPREDLNTTKQLPMRQDATELSSTSDLFLTHAVGGKAYIGATSGDATLQSRTGSLNIQSGLRVRIGGTDGSGWYIADSVKLTPTADNARACGQPNGRWTVVYAVNGTIQTSDGRFKEILEIEQAELDAGLELSANLIKYRWNGEDKIHFGCIAQEVMLILEKHGLDPLQYDMVQYDEEADIFGVNYAELNSFCIAALSRKLNAINKIS